MSLTWVLSIFIHYYTALKVRAGKSSAVLPLDPYRHTHCNILHACFSVADHTYSTGQLAKNSQDLTNEFHSLATNIWLNSAWYGMQGIWWRLGMLEWYVEQKSLVFQIPVQWFISSQHQSCSFFLNFTIFQMTVGSQAHIAPLHCLHLLLCVFHPRIWPKALLFLMAVFVYCRIIPSPLPRK